MWKWRHIFIPAEFDKVKWLDEIERPILLVELMLMVVGPGELALLATVNVILPGTGPSVCSMARRNVSIASEFDCCNRDTPLTFNSWSLVRNRLSRDAAPPCNTLLTKIPRSEEPEPLIFCVVLPFTLTPRPAFSVSCTGISNVKISRCFHGNIRLSSLHFSGGWNYF